MRAFDDAVKKFLFTDDLTLDVVQKDGLPANKVYWVAVKMKFKILDRDGNTTFKHVLVANADNENATPIILDHIRLEGHYPHENSLSWVGFAITYRYTRANGTPGIGFRILGDYVLLLLLYQNLKKYLCQKTKERVLSRKIKPTSHSFLREDLYEEAKSLKKSLGASVKIFVLDAFLEVYYEEKISFRSKSRKPKRIKKLRSSKGFAKL
jgi:hypothetical protein